MRVPIVLDVQQLADVRRIETANAVLYVGDAREVLPTLPRGSIDLLCTDPPYGVKFQSNRRTATAGFGAIANDDGSFDVVGALALATRGPLRNRRHVYVFGFPPSELAEPLRLGGTTELIWDKVVVGMGDLTSPWAPSFEKITFGAHCDRPSAREAGDGRLAARLRSNSVLRVPRKNAGGVTRHPTEKPVALMRMLIESSSMPGETVLDPFAGSGSTMVAAILSGRKAIGVELDEKYAEIAIARVRAAEELAARMARM